MSTNGNGQFREDELVSRKVKVGQEWQTRVFPIIGGRLRILHESNDHLSIETEIVRWEPDFVVVKAAIESQRGKFNGTGTASGQRDARLADSLVELAETRAIARALRFGGIGVEYTSAEEISHVTAGEPNSEQTNDKETASVFPEGNGTGKPEAKAQESGAAERSKHRVPAITERLKRRCEPCLPLAEKQTITMTTSHRCSRPLRFAALKTCQEKQPVS
jgi:hypothetical protein